MKVYIVFYVDDPYSGIILEGIFATKELAEEFIRKNKDWQDYRISEEDLITSFNQTL